MIQVPVKSISIANDASLVTVASQKGKLLIYTPGPNGKKLELSHEFQVSKPL